MTTIEEYLNYCTDNQNYRIRKELGNYLWDKVAISIRGDILHSLPRLQETLNKKQASEIIGLFLADKPKEATRKLFELCKLTKT